MITRILLGIRWIAYTKLVLLAIFVGLAIYANVPTTPSREDEQTFRDIGLEQISFEQQLTLIRTVQAEVFRRAPLGKGIPDYLPREPADLMKFGQGLCYDRSRTFDKAFNYLGFESRHVYMLYKTDKTFWRALFYKGQPSHAVTEVKTIKGWLFVDSNTAWVAVTRSGEPVGADDVWRRFDEFDSPPPYLREPWWAIRGMYSRKGQLYGAGIMFPELNWADFLSWFVFDRLFDAK